MICCNTSCCVINASCCAYRKKLSTFSVSLDWRHAMNYVAKRYMQTVDTAVYYEDVRLQMDAKLWGEEFNRHRPPKQVSEYDAG